jgi:hypothetical protein
MADTDNLTRLIGVERPASGLVVQPYAGSESPAVGNPEVVVPGGVVRISRYPVLLTRLPDDQTVLPEGNWLPDSYHPQAAGQLIVTGAVDAAVHLQVSFDGGSHWATLNGGAALPTGTIVTAYIIAVPGDAVQVATDSACAVIGGRVLWVADLV